MQFKQNTNVPNLKHKYIKNESLWIYSVGKLYKTEEEARKEKEKGFRFQLYTYNFYGLKWFKYETSNNKKVMLSLYKK